MINIKPHHLPCLSFLMAIPLTIYCVWFFCPLFSPPRLLPSGFTIHPTTLPPPYCTSLFHLLFPPSYTLPIFLPSVMSYSSYSSVIHLSPPHSYTPTYLPHLPLPPLRHTGGGVSHLYTDNYRNIFSLNNPLRSLSL